MPNIKIYTTTYCPYCVRAKNLLKGKNVKKITEIDVTIDDDLRIEMMEKSGGRKTVPQIFINDLHIGGFDDLAALDKSGKLENLLD